MGITGIVNQASAKINLGKTNQVKNQELRVGKQNFKETIKQMENTVVDDQANLKKADSSLGDSLIKTFNEFNTSWNQANAHMEYQIKKLNPQYQNLIKIQRSVQHIDVQTQVLTKVGDTFLHTLKRVEQMGGS